MQLNNNLGIIPASFLRKRETARWDSVSYSRHPTHEESTVNNKL
jgi:hypothetical protein